MRISNDIFCPMISSDLNAFIPTRQRKLPTGSMQKKLRYSLFFSILRFISVLITSRPDAERFGNFRHR